MLKEFKEHTNNFFLDYNKQTKCIIGMFRKENRLVLLPQMLRFVQPACYVSTVNKTNYRNKSDQNEHKFISDLPTQYDLY